MSLFPMEKCRVVAKTGFINQCKSFTRLTKDKSIVFGIYPNGLGLFMVGSV